MPVIAIAYGTTPSAIQPSFGAIQIRKAIAVRITAPIAM